MICGCSFHNNADNGKPDSINIEDSLKEDYTEAGDDTQPKGNPFEDEENVKVTKRGFIIMGEAPEARAFVTFRAGEDVTRPFINMVNEYRAAFPDKNIYAGVIPGAAAYYVPKKVADQSKPVKPAFDYLKANLDSTVRYVDIYNQLGAHTNEDIFLRTDHHWSPLGGYYAARALANAAGVPFKDLSNYDEHVVHGYVGSMTRYTGDASIKNSPEDFRYYTPRGTNETTYYTTYIADKTTGAITERGPHKGEFFHHYNDGSSGAYCTFMGGDHFLVKVETGVPNGRRILIIKDSHGNPIPAYLFHSFEEIHVVDYRYFTQNLKDYVDQNKISDIALIFGINTSSTPGSMKNVKNYLTQIPGQVKAYNPAAQK